MKKIKISIEGTSPLLMDRFSNEAYLAQKQARRITKEYNSEEEAEASAYWSSKGKKELIIPSMVLYASLLNGASWHKIQKRSAKTMLAGSIRIEPEEISLGTKEYEVDVRAVVIQRQRVLKGRARVDSWKATFTIVYNEKLIANPLIIKEVLEESGMRIGIMAFRPQKGGPYGTFKVTGFEEIQN